VQEKGGAGPGRTHGRRAGNRALRLLSTERFNPSFQLLAVI
jgi:hypothetical protein